MNLQSIVIVILRLVSLNFCLQVLTTLAPELLRAVDYSQRSSATNFDTMLALPWLMIAGFIGGAIVLWLFAESIARMITQGIPSDISLGSLTLADAYSILFIGVGLSYIASHFSPVLNWIQYFLSTAAAHPNIGWKEQGLNIYTISSAFIPFILGVILFVNGRKCALALARLHTAKPLTASLGEESLPSGGGN